MIKDFGENYEALGARQENELFIQSIKSIPVNSELPNWKQLIEQGKFVADIIRTLKISDKLKQQLIEDIAVAVQYHIFLPIKDELNALKKLNDNEDLNNDKFLCRMEEYCPGFIKTYINAFFNDILEEHKDEQLTFLTFESEEDK